MMFCRPIRSVEWRSVGSPLLGTFPRVDHVMIDLCEESIFEDRFVSTTLEAAKWPVVKGATVDDMGLNEPSGPYALRLNGHPSGGDSVESRGIDLSSYSDAPQLTYYYQRKGGGEAPDSGDDLILEYYNGSAWVELQRHAGSGPDMTTFNQVSLRLPRAALHAGFKLRIRSIGTASATQAFDDWFVDEVRIAPAPARYSAVGTWTVTTQWGTSAPGTVHFTFNVNGTCALEGIPLGTWSQDLNSITWTLPGVVSATYTGTITSHTTMSGTMTNSLGRSGVWAAVR